MMKKIYSIIYGIISIMLVCVPMYAQENDEHINFTFDFSGFTEKSIAARIFIFNEALLELEAGNTGKIKLKKKPEYYIRYEYFEKSASGKIISSDLVTLLLPPNIDEHLFIIPAPPVNLSGMATVTFLNSFDETVRIYVINSNNEHGYIGDFDDTRSASQKNSVIAPHGSDTFVIPAEKYKIEVRKADNEGTKLYDLDYIDLLPAIESSTIELSPDMVDRDKRRPVRATINYPNTSPDAVPLSPEFEIEFSASMITPPVASQLALAAIENPRIKIPLKLAWSDDNKKLQIQPVEALDYDTEYNLSLGLDVYDRQGNRLARAREWEFTTSRKDVPATKRVKDVPTSKQVAASLVFEGDELSAAEQHTLCSALQQGLKKAGLPMTLTGARPGAGGGGYRFTLTFNTEVRARGSMGMYVYSLSFEGGEVPRESGESFGSFSREWGITQGADWLMGKDKDKGNSEFYGEVKEELSR